MEHKASGSNTNSSVLDAQNQDMLLGKDKEPGLSSKARGKQPVGTNHELNFESVGEDNGLTFGRHTEAEPLQYRPLQGKEIRLITVERNRADGVLRCSIHHAPLSTELRFHALSYVWGDPKNKEVILVNEKPMEVTRNLYSFLDQVWRDEDLFRRKEPIAHQDLGELDEAECSTGPLHWWTDAICINQGDIDEKSVQVPRMGELYSSAIRVWMWLGPSKTVFSRNNGEFPLVKLALSSGYLRADPVERSKPVAKRLYNASLNAMSKLIARLVLDRMERDVRATCAPILEDPSMPELDVVAEMLKAGLSENEIREAVGIHPAPQDAPEVEKVVLQRHLEGHRSNFEKSLFEQLLREFDQILSNPWFDRTWIIQEFVLGRTPPVAVIGNYTFYLTCLYQLGKEVMCDASIINTSLISRVRSFASKFQKLAALVNAFAINQGLGGDALNFAGDSTESKLLHLLRQFSRKQSTVPHDHVYGMLGLLEAQLPKSVTPNYRLPFEQVCQDYARYILSSTKDLKAIEVHRSELQQCPSWVPDFRYFDDLRSFASRCTTGDVTFSADGQHLTVQGVRIGGLISCSCSFPGGSDPLDQLNYIGEVLLESVALITGRPLSELFMSWLHTHVALERLPRSIVGGITCMGDLIQEYSELCRHIPPDALEALPRIPPEELSFLYDTNCANPGLLHFVLLITTLPRYGLMDTGEIGLCRLKNQLKSDHRRHSVDDSVWALKGCQSLAILQPVDGGYAYAGTFRVHPGQYDFLKEVSLGHKANGDSQYVLDEEFFVSKVLEEVTLV
jgi:hypothetical protein